MLAESAHNGEVTIEDQVSNLQVKLAKLKLDLAKAQQAANDQNEAKASIIRQVLHMHAESQRYERKAKSDSHTKLLIDVKSKASKRTNLLHHGVGGASDCLGGLKAWVIASKHALDEPMLCRLAQPLGLGFTLCGLDIPGEVHLRALKPAAWLKCLVIGAQGLDEAAGIQKTPEGIRKPPLSGVGGARRARPQDPRRRAL